ncbi:muscle-specific calpain [Thecamonas trahens ATCC 50062]|uniref:Muscle-specific calpain n=1 Tax=Thecamonas trahens ATCC 50062 TaxID=461836 RepID=A0A0L0DVT2_THETB|nr:muscle-specific calpain [Thecamonas trahens ATCC 50062]KNC55623.1 muscle-specific calpain [Thecamonas trahens ATCC 50062]|eukprot:XP_013761396.1 muscle-specific calpain [Thecamonas trahens ATCC 50062]
MDEDEEEALVEEAEAEADLICALARKMTTAVSGKGRFSVCYAKGSAGASSSPVLVPIALGDGAPPLVFDVAVAKEAYSATLALVPIAAEAAYDVYWQTMVSSSTTSAQLEYSPQKRPLPPRRTLRAVLLVGLDTVAVDESTVFVPAADTFFLSPSPYLFAHGLRLSKPSPMRIDWYGPGPETPGAAAGLWIGLVPQAKAPKPGARFARTKATVAADLVPPLDGEEHEEQEEEESGGTRARRSNRGRGRGGGGRGRGRSSRTRGGGGAAASSSTAAPEAKPDDNADDAVPEGMDPRIGYYGSRMIPTAALSEGVYVAVVGDSSGMLLAVADKPVTLDTMFRDESREVIFGDVGITSDAVVAGLSHDGDTFDHNMELDGLTIEVVTKKAGVVAAGEGLSVTWSFPSDYTLGMEMLYIAPVGKGMMGTVAATQITKASGSYEIDDSYAGAVFKHDVVYEAFVVTSTAVRGRSAPFTAKMIDETAAAAAAAERAASGWSIAIADSKSKVQYGAPLVCTWSISTEEAEAMAMTLAVAVVGKTEAVTDGLPGLSVTLDRQILAEVEFKVIDKAGLSFSMVSDAASDASWRLASGSYYSAFSTVLKSAKAAGTRYSDSSFISGAASSLWLNPAKPPPDEYIAHPEHEWLPCILPSSTDDFPCPIEQGGIGDCYLISSLNVMASARHADAMLRDLFVGYDIIMGAYALSLYRFGIRKLVTIDDLVPATPSGKPLFAWGEDRGQLYAPLIEKAYAAMYGCYEAIDGGLERFAMMEMTGGMAMAVPLPAALTPGALATLWDTVLAAFDSGALLACSRAHDDPENFDTDPETGIVYNHAYGIVKAVQLKNKTKTRLLQIRNPHGSGEWSGAWSDDSPLWTAKLRAAAGATESKVDDGLFFMSIEDFATYFTAVDACYPIPDGWGHASFETQWTLDNVMAKDGIAPLDSFTPLADLVEASAEAEDAWWHAPSVRITVASETEVIVALYQSDMELFVEASDPSHPVYRRTNDLVHAVGIRIETLRRGDTQPQFAAPVEGDDDDDDEAGFNFEFGSPPINTTTLVDLAPATEPQVFVRTVLPKGVHIVYARSVRADIQGWTVGHLRVFAPDLSLLTLDVNECCEMLNTKFRAVNLDQVMGKGGAHKLPLATMAELDVLAMMTVSPASPAMAMAMAMATERPR